MDIFQKQLLKLLNEFKFKWQLCTFLSVYTIIMTVAFYLKWQIGIAMLLFLSAVVVYWIRNTEKILKSMNQSMNDIIHNSKITQEDSLYRSPIGVLLYDHQNIVRWINPSFQHIYGTKSILGKKITQLGTEFVELLTQDDDDWRYIKWNGGHYRIMHQMDLKAIYLMDVTEDTLLKQQHLKDKVVFGYLYLDDYEELLQSLDDQQETKVDAAIVNDLNKWAKSEQFYLKRIDEENFIMILNQHILNRLEKNKFKKLTHIKEQHLLNNIQLSISVGIAYSASEEDYRIDSLSKQAQLNLDLALGRGGNQVVVRASNHKARFYGGTTNPVEKRTTIRSKLVYQALLNSIEQSSNIIIAGHRYPDMDSIASAIGIYRIVTHYKKSVKILINQDELNSDIVQLLDTPQLKNEWKQMFVDLATAKEMMNDDTLIIMVDHHRPSLSEARELIENHDVVVIDHHRRSEEFPENSVLTFIEPYASSTAELVTEFFIYTRNTHHSLSKIDATALLAGIIIDTHNFALRTGERTFNVASYLRSLGADMLLIQFMLKEDLSSVQKRNRIIESVKYVRDNIVVAKGNDDEICDNVIASQATDSMLNLKNVEAAFTIYRRTEDTVGISARSLGTINVQTIMEQLGGGGHLSNAATQLKNKTIDESYELLLQLLNDH